MAAAVFFPERPFLARGTSAANFQEFMLFERSPQYIDILLSYFPTYCASKRLTERRADGFEASTCLTAVGPVIAE
jgi:hypothetical protein